MTPRQLALFVALALIWGASYLLIRIERCASKHKCTPHVTVKMHRTVAAGTRSLAFSGRVELRKLRPGGYRFVLDATDLSDNFSDTVYVPFIVAPG